MEMTVNAAGPRYLELYMPVVSGFIPSCIKHKLWYGFVPMDDDYVWVLTRNQEDIRMIYRVYAWFSDSMVWVHGTIHEYKLGNVWLRPGLLVILCW